MKQRGFTIIELSYSYRLLMAVTVIAWTQINTLKACTVTIDRRTAINSMYYSLEDVYYVKNKSYPTHT